MTISSHLCIVTICAAGYSFGRNEFTDFGQNRVWARGVYQCTFHRIFRFSLECLGGQSSRPMFPMEANKSMTANLTSHMGGYQHLNNQTSGVLTFNAPTQAGTYDFRMNDTDDGSIGIEVASVTFTVATDTDVPPVRFPDVNPNIDLPSLPPLTVFPVG